MRYKGTYEGNSLRHYRTPGSKNGYSKDPNYRPVGQRAMSPEEYQRRLAEQRRIAGGSQGTSTQASRFKQGLKNVGLAPIRAIDSGINNVELQRKKKIAFGTAVVGDAGAEALVNRNSISRAQARRNAEARRIRGGSQGTITRARANQKAAEARRIAGGSQGTSKSMITAAGRRSKGVYENASKAVSGALNDAERGAKNLYSKGSKAVSGALNDAERGAKNLYSKGSKAVSGALNDAERGAKNLYSKGSKMASNISREVGQGVNRAMAEGKRLGKAAIRETKEGANYAVNEGKSLVKKGKKKVKSLMKRFFG